MLHSPLNESLTGDPFSLEQNQGDASYLCGVFKVLLLTDVQQPLLLDLIGERFKTELGTSGSQWLDDPKNHTETHHG